MVLAGWNPSSETQGQILGARESLNGRKNMARRKEKDGEKSPWGQCLTRPVPNGRHRSAFWLGRKTQKFSGTNRKPERRRPSDSQRNTHIDKSADIHARKRLSCILAVCLRLRSPFLFYQKLVSSGTAERNFNWGGLRLKTRAGDACLLGWGVGGSPLPHNFEI